MFKYGLNQIVWFMEDNKIKCGTVVRRTYYETAKSLIRDDLFDACVYYELDGVQQVKYENLLYKTRQDLIESL
jgi:hypothetical protein